jgi:hypothetical protein
MRKWLLIIAALMIAGPAWAGSINVLGGYVRPNGDSDVFQQNELETTFDVRDLDGFGVTVGYDHFLGDYINLGGSFSFYRSDTTVSDVDFEFNNGAPILRDIRLEIVPIEANLHFLPAGRETVVIPYVGGGVGIYVWQYEEIGDFVIDRNTDPSIITGSAFSDGADLGFHVEGGVFIPIGRSVAIMGEAKYWNAEGDLDIEGFDPSFEPIDLSGTMYSGGISIWF